MKYQFECDPITACNVCPICKADEDTVYAFCEITLSDVNNAIFTRPDNCPLVEVEDKHG